MARLPAGRPPIPTLFPYTTLFRSSTSVTASSRTLARIWMVDMASPSDRATACIARSEGDAMSTIQIRSEEHTSELQSRLHLVCRLLLEKKNQKHDTQPPPSPHDHS